MIAVHESQKSFNKKYYLELREKASGDTVYFEYNSVFEHDFPFIVVNFYDKQKRELVGTSYVFPNVFLKSSTDIETGKPITNTSNQKWECIDLTIDDKYYALSLVLKNKLGEKVMVAYNFINKAYKFSEAKAYEKKFGAANWLKILDEKVLIGFTEEMVLLSWGKPKTINRSSHGGDQWVYDGQYLYFEQGKLKAFN